MKHLHNSATYPNDTTTLLLQKIYKHGLVGVKKNSQREIRIADVGFLHKKTKYLAAELRRYPRRISFNTMQTVGILSPLIPIRFAIRISLPAGRHSAYAIDIPLGQISIHFAIDN
jgi:hypothetical protein